MSLVVQCIGGPYHGSVHRSASRQVLVIRQHRELGGWTSFRYRIATTADGHAVGLYQGANQSRAKTLATTTDTR